MIQTNELRLGDLILKNGKIYEITTLFFVDLHDGTVRENYNNSYVIEPIKLTEEWLLKFGFEKGNDFYGDCFYIETEKEDFVLHPEKDYFYFLYDLVEVKYVNQLQNLYFALTNEELTLKP